MNIDTYIENCLVEHEGTDGNYYILGKLSDRMFNSQLEYIFTNLYTNNSFLAKQFINSILDDTYELGPIFKGDVIVKVKKDN